MMRKKVNNQILTVLRMTSFLQRFLPRTEKHFKIIFLFQKVNNKKGGGDQTGSARGRETNFFFTKSYSETKGILGAFAPIRVLEN